VPANRRPVDALSEMHAASERVDPPLAWLPFSAASLGGAPSSLRYEEVDPSSHVPASVSEVAFYVMPSRFARPDVEVIAQMSALEVIQLQTAGFDHVRRFVREGVTLCNGRGIHDAATAELAMTLMLASLRGVPDFIRAQDAQHWTPRFTRGLADSTVLIVGFGAIGRALERRLAPFEVEVLKVARTARANSVHAFDELPMLLPSADVVVLILPLTNETRGLVDAEFLSNMKDGALLVNVARGAIVDSEALAAELRTGRISAALDVTDPEPLLTNHPLWSAPNLLVTPHVGGATAAMEPRARRLLREQLDRFATGRNLANVVLGEY
jgi:phosphoglycerate dehydrogenase-like enzyme